MLGDEKWKVQKTGQERRLLNNAKNITQGCKRTFTEIDKKNQFRSLSLPGFLPFLLFLPMSRPLSCAAEEQPNQPKKVRKELLFSLLFLSLHAGAAASPAWVCSAQKDFCLDAQPRRRVHQIAVRPFFRSTQFSIKDSWKEKEEGNLSILIRIICRGSYTKE